MNHLNPFELLNISPKYDVCAKELEKAYLKAQLAYHPDRLIHKSDIEKQQAQLQSSTMNAAYTALKDDVKRAQACLQVLKIPIPGQSNQTVADKTLLLEILEKREQIEEALPEQRDVYLNNLVSEVDNQKQKFRTVFLQIQENEDDSTIQDLKITLQTIYLKILYFSKILQDFS